MILTQLSCRKKILRGPLYFLTIPLAAIYLTGRALLCGDTKDEETNKDWTAYTKVPEVLCEALPQVS